LIFDIEAHDADGTVLVQAERMWVLVTELVEDQYIGLLTNKPGIEGDFCRQHGHNDGVHFARRLRDIYRRVDAQIPWWAWGLFTDAVLLSAAVYGWSIGRHSRAVVLVAFVAILNGAVIWVMRSLRRTTPPAGASGE
jgi:hypothetical protein